MGRESGGEHDFQGTLSRKEEMHKEEVAFNEFKVWRNQTPGEIQKAIKDAADSIMQLSADIEKALADAKNLKKEIADLEDPRNVAEDELNAATKIRAKQSNFKIPARTKATIQAFPLVLK